MRQTQISSPVARSAAPCPSLRFTPVIHLRTGETALQSAELIRGFEEGPQFGRAAPTPQQDKTDETPLDWLAQKLETIAHAAHGQMQERPIILALPLVALVHRNTAQICDDIIARTPLCPQEICFEITDAALALPGIDAQEGVENLRRCGFRVSVDATSSWQAPLHPALCLLLDNIRIDTRRLDLEPDLLDRVEASVCSGMSVIACKAAWRDQDWLADLGIDYAIRPRADA